MDKMVLVSIVCLTYNHEDFIKKCLDGFLMQQCSFSYEILIHDDASTDNTQKIIKHYQANNPGMVKTILQEKNQWTNNKGLRFMAAVYPKIQGKYIALCEGDDYWTDPLKLEKQVSFLKENPDYTLTTSGYARHHSGNTERRLKSGHPTFIDESDKGFTYTLQTRGGWLTKTLTAVFRNKKDVFEKCMAYKHGRDVHLFYHLLKEGKGYYFKEIFGVYNVHSGGVFSMNSQRKKDIDHYHLYKELYAINGDEYSRLNYLTYLKKYIQHVSKESSRMHDLSKYQLIKSAYSISKTSLERKSISYLILPDGLKKVYRNIRD